MENESEWSCGDWIENARDTLENRGLEYGDPRYNLLRIYKIAKLLGVQLRDPSDLALVFIATKLSRYLESPGRSDSIIDLIGYAAILGVTTSVDDWDDIEPY